jgi:hypothetical protein
VNGANGSAVQGRKMSDPFHFTGSTTTLLTATAGNREHQERALHSVLVGWHRQSDIVFN